jgi:phosphate transport system ATP-binding protein
MRILTVNEQKKEQNSILQKQEERLKAHVNGRSHPSPHDPKERIFAAGEREPEIPETKVRVAELRVGFGSHAVLKGISADFPTGQITALLGPTGSGKTTLLRTINRLTELVPDFRITGQVELDGVDIYRGIPDVREVRRRVGMLFQRPNPFPQSIKENIAIGLRAHHIVPPNQVDDEVERQLSEVGLWEAVKDKRGQSPFSLSGGQQQLLCLARTLAVRPEVILLDEPTSSLDPISTQRVEDLIARLKERITIIMVTHNIQQAARVSDYVVLLNAGELVDAGSAQEIFINTKNKITEDFLTGRMR